MFLYKPVETIGYMGFPVALLDATMVAWHSKTADATVIHLARLARYGAHVFWMIKAGFPITPSC